MRTILIACAALAALVAASSRTSTLTLRQPLEARREYRYTYDGALTSGLPIETDGAVSRISSEVIVQMVDDRTIHMKLSKVRISASHVRPEQLKQQQRLAPSDMLEEREIDSEYRRMLEAPVRATYRQGLISEVQFAEEDEAWSKNIKRAVLNMLQMNMDKSQRRQSSEERLMEEKPVSTEAEQYSVPEKTIEGDCDATYTVTREGDRLVLTKSINFNKCLNTDGTQVTYGQRFESECEQCEKQSQIVNPSTQYTYVIERDQLKSVEVHSTYQVTLKDQPMMKTETTGRLVLKTEESLEKQITAPRNMGPKEDLIYSNEWEEIIERFFKNGEKEEKFPFTRMETEMKMKQIKRIAESLSRKEENTAESSHDLARLVLLQRMLSEKEMTKQHNEIYESASDKTKEILEHAMAIAGTHNTIKHLIHHIEKEDVTPVKASTLLKQVAETPFPSERIVDMLVRLAKSSVAKRSPVLRQSCWLSAGAVMRGVVGETKDRMLINEATKDIKEKFIEVLMKEFESAETTYEKVLALKTLANAGIDLSVYKLHKIIYDRSEKIGVRIEAIEALRLLKDTMPRKIQQILLPIYKDGKQPTDIRMAALVRIMHTMPEADVLAQIGHHVDRMSCKQTATFTYRVISEIASSTNPCYKKLSVLCKELLSTLRFVPTTEQLSSFSHFSLFDQSTLSGMQMNLASVFGPDSSLPKALSASVDTLFAGNWNKYFAQFGFTQQNLDSLVEKVMRKLENSHSTVVRGRRGQQTLSMLKELAQKLNIRPRDVRSTQEPHVMFYMRWKEMDYAMVPLSEKIIEEFAESLISNGRITPEQMSRLVNREHKFSAHAGVFFYESIRKLPTTLGLPLTVSGKLPTVMSVEGEFEMKLLPLGVRMTLKAKPTVAATHVTTMKVWTPILEQGVKILTNVEFNTPVDFELEASVKNQLEITYKFNGNEKEMTMRAARRPVAFLRFNKNRREYTEPEQRTLSHPFEKQLIREVDYESTEMAGMIVRVNGLVLPTWEQADTALFCEQHIEVECIIRDPIVAKLTVEKIEEARIESPVEGRDVFAEEFADNYKSKKTESDEEEEYDSNEYTPRDEKKRRAHFEKRVSEWKKDSQQGYKHRMTARVESKGRHAEMTIRTECDKQINYCRVQLDARRPALFEDERNEWTLKSKTAVFLPHMPSTIEELEEQEHREIQAIVNAEWGCGKKSEVTLKMQLGQSPMQTKWTRVYKRLGKQSGMTAYQTLVKAARLNELKTVVEYENLSPLTVVYMNRAYELYKAASYFSTSRWQLKDVQQKERLTGRVFMRVTVEPMTRRYMNVSMETETERVEWQSLTLPTRMPLLSIARASMRQQYSTMSTSECRVQADRVNTYDSVPFRAPLTTCYSVLSKDCSSIEQPRFAVLAKRLTKRSEKIALKIVNENDDELEIIPEEKDEEKSMRVIINGKTIRHDDEESLNEFGIETISNEVIRVKLTDIEVRFDGYNVKTHLSRRFNSKQCGLCGHYDGEESNEFRMADNTETEDLEEFHRSFLVKNMKNEECEIEEERVSNKNNYKTYEKSFYDKETKEDEDDEEEEMFEEEYTNKKYNKKTGKKYYEDSEEKDIEPVKKTKVVEFAHRVCFSKEPVAECPRNTQPETTHEQKVHFTCMPREERKTRDLLKKSRDGKTLRLSDLPSTYVESVVLPKTCEVY